MVEQERGETRWNTRVIAVAVTAASASAAGRWWRNENGTERMETLIFNNQTVVLILFKLLHFISTTVSSDFMFHHLTYNGSHLKFICFIVFVWQDGTECDKTGRSRIGLWQEWGRPQTHHHT